jgi:hypothetical protein
LKVAANSSKVETNGIGGVLLRERLEAAGWRYEDSRPSVRAPWTISGAANRVALGLDEAGSLSTEENS